MATAGAVFLFEKISFLNCKYLQRKSQLLFFCTHNSIDYFCACWLLFVFKSAQLSVATRRVCLAHSCILFPKISLQLEQEQDEEVHMSRQEHTGFK